MRLSQRHLTACILVLFCSVATFAKSKQEPLRRANVHLSETTFNLADFGAVGDGVADDGPALQSALDAIEVAGGGTLLIPSGRYLIATPVVKDFSSVSNATLTIQGVPSLTMPAPPTAGGNELAAGLDLTSELIPATGQTQIAINLSNIHQLSIEHVGFTGREAVATDAFITLYLLNIDEATIRHCEFYGLYSVNGNIIRADRSELSIELTVFLGCSANSGVYGPIVENLEWRRFSIANSIFLDYGLRAFFGKTGYGSPLSWINIGNAQAPTPESSRREVIVRDTFLDEGGWIGLTVLPYRFCPPCSPIDLIYISGLKMNVSNLNTAGHKLYDAQNLLIENSRYGWSHLTDSAVDINRFGNVILDNLTCIDSADRIRVDAATQRLTVINSVYRELASLAPSTTVMQTSPEDDPVQYVRRQFVSVIGRQPDPAAHFYWSDLLIRCGNNNDCLNQTRSDLGEYLNKRPSADFAITGTALDENGDPLVGATVNLTGSQSVATTTDSQGSFRFSRLPTVGNYNVTLSKRHYFFLPATQNIKDATADVSLTFDARLTLFAITGTALDENHAPLAGATVNLTGSQSAVTTTDLQGSFRFPGLPTIGNYNVTLSKRHYTFLPATQNITDVTDDVSLTFDARLNRHAIAGRIAGVNGASISGILVRLDQSPEVTQITDVNGFYSFTQVPAGQNYTVTPEPNTDFVFAPVTTTFSDLSGDQTANFMGWLRPEITTEPGSNVALALDSVTFIAQPFSPFNSLDFSNDGFLRITIFAKKVEPSVTLSQVSVLAEDNLGQFHPLQIEGMGNVPGQSWLKQFNLKLATSTFSNSCIKVRLTIASVPSNEARICLGQVTDLPNGNNHREP